MRGISAILILSILAAAFLSKEAFCEEERLAVAAEKAVVLFMRGSVKVKSEGSERWKAARVDLMLAARGSLKTGSNSWAEIGFGEDFKNAVRIREKTLVEFIDLGPVEIGLLEGEIRSLVEGLAKDSTFEIKTPTAVCGARGTGWDTNTDGKRVVVNVYEEKVYFTPLPGEGAGVDPIINAGKSGSLEDPARPVIIKDLDPGKMEDWNKWKKDFKDRMSKKGKKGSLTKMVGGVIQGVVGKVGRTEKTIEDLMKGKEGIFEKKDMDSIERRLERHEGGGEVTRL